MCSGLDTFALISAASPPANANSHAALGGWRFAMTVPSEPSRRRYGFSNAELASTGSE